MIGIYEPLVSAGLSKSNAGVSPVYQPSRSSSASKGRSQLEAIENSSTFYQPKRGSAEANSKRVFEKVGSEAFVYELIKAPVFAYIEQCGDTRVTKSEQCDSWNLNGAQCYNFGMGGALSCTSQCRFDYSGCYNPSDPYGEAVISGAPPSLCGNWMIDQGELCDNNNMPLSPTLVCKSLGYFGGYAKCKASCNDYDISGCYGAPGDPYGTPSAPSYVPACGNGYLDSGEQCDGAKTPGTGQYNAIPDACASQGFYGGTTKCNSDCTLNTELCYGVTGDPYGGSQHCGDGVVNSQDGEECEGGNFPCTTLGYFAGTAYCSPYCKLWTGNCSGWGADPYGTPPNP